jgi:hypothetical protein
MFGSHFAGLGSWADRARSFTRRIRTSVCADLKRYCLGLAIVVCALVGRTEGALAAGWSSIPDTPVGTEAVSCPSSNDCVVAGIYVSPTDGTIFSGDAAAWNGRRWAAQQLQQPAAPEKSVLNDVSCPSPTDCIAVGGQYGNAASGGDETTFAERWDGTDWMIEPTPSPSDAGNSELDTVSCPSATVCIAVGFKTPVGGGMGRALAEAWDGTSWKMLPTPVGTGLESVWCISATACTAVGTNGVYALAERWDGSSWTVEPAPSPGGSNGTYLDGVSCTSMTACTAVGASNTGSWLSRIPEAPLAERWDGSEWSWSRRRCQAALGAVRLDQTEAGSAVCLARLRSPVSLSGAAHGDVASRRHGMGPGGRLSRCLAPGGAQRLRCHVGLRRDAWLLGAASAAMRRSTRPAPVDLTVSRFDGRR